MLQKLLLYRICVGAEEDEVTFLFSHSLAAHGFMFLALMKTNSNNLIVSSNE